jgi:hypothetical protein
MLAKLPLEIIDGILGYLDFEDIRSIARVCSAFRLPAQLLLFKIIHIRIEYEEDIYPTHIQSILSSPHLLQYPSILIVYCFGFMLQAGISFHSLWSHLPMMNRLLYVELDLQPSDCSRALSALESCDSSRKIGLRLGRILAPDMLISDNPLPVHTLQLIVHPLSQHVATRLVQKCSQSLRRLDLFPSSDIAPTFPFLPHLYEFSVTHTEPLYRNNDHDFTPWFPFLAQHPTITRLALGTSSTLAVQPPPDLLPNLQFLEAPPAIFERLLPGRPVNDIQIKYPSDITPRFPVDITLHPLKQPFVLVTTLEIKIDAVFPDDVLINIVRSLPKLRKFTLERPHYEVRKVSEGRRYSKLIEKQVPVTLQDLLTALGRCKDMVHIRMDLLAIRVPPLGGRSLFSRGDFVQMVQRVQENGAADLWSFRFGIQGLGEPEICDAMRVRWLDVSWQPTLRGEWQFYLQGVSSEDSDIPMPTPNATVDS